MHSGNLERLVYGYDSYGFLCGTDNKGAFGEEDGPDLSAHKKLYYLNAIELLDAMHFKAAKRICVRECPSVDDVCDALVNPICTEANRFRQGDVIADTRSS